MLNNQQGYTYCGIIADDDATTTLSMMATGFHQGNEDIDGATFVINSSELMELQPVSMSEAESGIGTYLSSMVVVSFDPEDSTPNIWRYGTIIAYNFDLSLITLADENGRFIIAWTGTDGFGVVNEAIYALAPYRQKSTVEVSGDILNLEFDRIETAMEGGKGIQGKRKAEAIDEDAGCRGGDDLIVVFTVNELECKWISVQHAINWIYYSQEGRKVPQDLTKLECDPRVGPDNLLYAATDKFKWGQRLRRKAIPRSPRQQNLGSSAAPSKDNSVLDDVIKSLEQKSLKFQSCDVVSESDSEDEKPTVNFTQSNKTKRLGVGGGTHSGIGTGHVTSSRDQLTELRQQLEHQMTAHQSLLEKLSRAEAMGVQPRSDTIFKSTSDKSQFRPSDQQLRVHQMITLDNVTGKIHGKSGAHPFCEDLVSEEFYQMDPHPQVRVGIYDCAFGPGRLSILHGRKVLDYDIFSLYRNQQVAMRDFSNKGKVPIPTAIKDNEDGAVVIIQCVHNWIRLTKNIWKPQYADAFHRIEVVVEEFNGARAHDMTFPSSMFVDWIDLKLYKLRTALSSSDDIRVATALTNISIDHRSFRMVEMASRAHKSETKSKGNPTTTVRASIPKAVSDNIPTDASGKRACLRYWTYNGCKGKGKVCDSEHYVHITPKRSEVPENVIQYVEQTYGRIKDRAFIE